MIGEPSRRSLLFAALAAIPAGAAAGATAANLHGLPIPRSETISLIVPNGQRRHVRHPLAIRQTRSLDESDLTTINGFRSLTVERTICDLAAERSAAEIQFLIEWSITNRRMTKSSFQACVRSFCRRGRKGSALIRDLDNVLLDDEPFPASRLEALGARLFRRNGLGPFVLQFVPPWSDGLVGIVDVAWPDLKLIIELDGRRWHSVTRAQRNDRRRDRRANEHGWFILRFGWQEIVERPGSVVGELRRFIESRRRSLAKDA